MTAAEHAATVREAIVGIARGHALASLVWLEEQAARAEAAEEERDRLQSILTARSFSTTESGSVVIHEWQVRAEAAEVRVAQLETALRQIAECAESCLNVDDTTLREEWVAKTARAVLAADRETET